jgi:peptidyl-prolyl cis-trans isomerase D
MLSSLRRAAKTKVASVIIGALIMAFALWGVNDIFRGGVSNVVAEVGDTDITGVEFDREFRARLRAIPLPDGSELTVEQARALGMDQNVLDGLISGAALDEASQRLGLTAPDTIVAEYIRSLPEFGANQGGFNPVGFQQIIRQMGYTEPQYVERARREVARAQLLLSVGADAPPGLTRLLSDINNETRVPEFVLLTPDDAGAIPAPTEMDLANYHMAHPELFSAPEYRGFEYIEIGPAQVTDKVQVAEEDIRREYEAQRASFDTPEQREIEQISFPDKAAADAAAERLRMGTSFAALAQERGLADEDYKLGLLRADGLDSRLSAVAFATEEGQASAPVEGPFGWVILRNARTVPAASRTFEEMRDSIQQSIARAAAAVHIQDLVNLLEDERGAGASIEEAAMKLNLPFKRVAAVDSMGMTPEATQAEVPTDPVFLQQVFSMEEGDESDPFRTEEDHNYVVRITNVTPMALKPLDQVRDTVRQGWEADRRVEALRMRAETLANEARTSSLAQAARTLGKAPTMGMPLRRTQPSDVLSEALKTQFFSEPEGAIVFGPTPSGTNYVVVRVADVQQPAQDMAAPEYEQFRVQTRQQMAGDVIEAMAAAARQDAGVTVHPEVIQQLLGDPVQ